MSKELMLRGTLYQSLAKPVNDLLAIKDAHSDACRIFEVGEEEADKMFNEVLMDLQKKFDETYEIYKRTPMYKNHRKKLERFYETYRDSEQR